MAAESVQLNYVDKFDPDAYTFADAATTDKIQSTVDIMVVMATQPNKKVSRATTTVYDGISNKNYVILLTISPRPAPVVEESA